MNRNKMDEKLQLLADEKAAAVLRRLHGESGRQTWGLICHYLPYLYKLLSGKKLPWGRLEKTHNNDYLSIGAGAGIHLYLLARALNAKRIVEFGTSFGISTIYLACAVRDNGGGLVTGTEMVPSKAAIARRNFEEAGLAEFIEIREGNAVESLRGIEGPIDFHFSDGYPQYALPVLQAVAPNMRRGAIVLNHNALFMTGDHVDYTAWLRDPANGFKSGLVPMMGEFSVRVAD